jgi:hypothetical protein
MRQPVHKRLQKLEEASARTRKQSEASDAEANGATAIQKIKLFLQMRDVEKGPMESLEEALARALEISPRELRRLLEAGIDPMYQYLADTGIYEDIQRRKAAGTMASG